MPKVKIMNTLMTLVIIFSGLSCVAKDVGGVRGDSTITFDWPVDYEVTKKDWLDMGREKVGWPLGYRWLRGKTLKERNGIHPIHVMKADLSEFGEDLIKVDDLLLAVNGMPLGREGVDQINLEYKRAVKLGKSLGFTRWRRGEIADVSLDFRAAVKEFNIPDLTKGGKPDESTDWSMGPLGAQGWSYSFGTSKGGTYKARQAVITYVDPIGPAKDQLQLGDVVVGLDGKNFTSDIRRALSEAINLAEEELGQVRLKVWRPIDEDLDNKGKTLDVVIKIPVLGAYSKNAPFDCPKTEKIIEGALDYMKANPKDLLKPNWIGFVNGLGLMATGREDVLPMVKDLAKASLLKEGETLSVEKHVSMMCWRWTYRLLFLSEYYLLTQDASVLPTIEEYATKLSLGQSGAGTWGHTYAAKENTGYYHGHLGGYGAINQMGLTAMVALPLVKKCGIENQEINDALQRGYEFFSYFIGKGTIPYGDHGAAPWYDDNGKSGAAAVYFDLVNERKGTDFFSKMVLGSAPGGRDDGHTGHFWSHLWGGVGALRGGEALFVRFMKEMRPMFTLERQHNGRFAFQRNIGEKGDRGVAKTRWDCTGARLLQLCAPKRVLYITGKGTPPKSTVSPQRMNEIVEAGQYKVNKEKRSKMSVDEILLLLQDPLPPTRQMAVDTLEEREINCVPKLLEMLRSSSRFAKYGAAQALGRVGFARKDAAETLIEMMEKEKDTLFRINAMRAMTNTNLRLGLAKHAKPAIPVLLKMATEHSKDDPRQVLQSEISLALFFSERGGTIRGLIPRFGLEGVDRKLLIPAVREILTNKNGAARSLLTGTMYPLLRDDELSQLWPDIYAATRYIAPSGIMFASEARVDGLKLMAEKGIKEGMFLSAWYARWQKGHCSDLRLPKALSALEEYGQHAKPLIPYLEEHAKHFISTRNPKRPISEKDRANYILKSIEALRSSNEEPTLVSIMEFLDPAVLPPKDGP